MLKIIESSKRLTFKKLGINDGKVIKFGISGGDSLLN